MRTHGSWCVIFTASLGTLASLPVPAAHAQLAPTAPFNQYARPATVTMMGTVPRTPLGASLGTPLGSSLSTTLTERTARFQSGDLQMPQSEMPQSEMAQTEMSQTGMPQFAMPSAPSLGPSGSVMPPSQMPGLVAPAVGDYNQMNTGAAVSPASFNQFSNPGGPMAATQVQPPVAPSRFRDSQTGEAPNVNQPGYRNTSMQQPPMQQQTLPPGYGWGNNAYAPQQQQQQQYNLPPAHFRNSTGGVPAQPVGMNQGPVVSSDPRFVSQPPRQSNYATSPYQPFRTVSYQLPQQSPPVQQVQPPSVLPNQPQTVANTTALPQYQTTVGYQAPVGAQLTNYQALQPGYNCPPTIPSNGVPAYVPGAIAPPTLPPNLTPQLYTPDNSGYRPLFSLGQENYNVQLGRGIIGQPTVYVAGQYIRNFLRYISP